MKQTSIAIDISADYGRATNIYIAHDIGDPSLLCRAMATIPDSATPSEIADELEHLAKTVRAFDAVREDARKELANVVTVDLKDTKP